MVQARVGEGAGRRAVSARSPPPRAPRQKHWPPELMGCLTDRHKAACAYIGNLTRKVFTFSLDSDLLY